MINNQHAGSHVRPLARDQPTPTAHHRFLQRPRHAGRRTVRLSAFRARLRHVEFDLGRGDRLDLAVSLRRLYLGGRWADRSPYPITLYRLIAWGAFLIGLIPFLALPLLRLARDSLQNLGNLNVALIVLAFGVTLILFAVPVTLLGCVSPFAVRLAHAQRRTVGRTVGRLYAVSTLGSFIGSFLPELVLLDLFGTRGTFVFLALLLLSAGPVLSEARAR